MNEWDLSNALLDKLNKIQEPDEWIEIIKKHDEEVKNRELVAADLIAQMRDKSARGEINHHILYLLIERPTEMVYIQADDKNSNNNQSTIENTSKEV